MTRKEKIAQIKHMLYCLQLIVTNEEIAYYFSDVIILDDFMLILCNKLYGKKYLISNYLENFKYPYEITDHQDKIINQIILSSDNETIYEVFDSFEELRNQDSKFNDYSLYITFLGVDTISSLSSLKNSLRDYDFNYKFFGAEDIIESLSTIRDEELLRNYFDLIQSQSDLFSVLLRKENELMDRLLQVLSKKSNFISSTPTIFPQTSKEFYENTATLKTNQYPHGVYANIIKVLNAYSRHNLGTKYCIGAVYSYLRETWLRLDIKQDEVPHKVHEALSKALLRDIDQFIKGEEMDDVNGLIDAIIIEAFMRLKVDYNLYDH